MSGAKGAKGTHRGRRGHIEFIRFAEGEGANAEGDAFETLELLTLLAWKSDGKGGTMKKGNKGSAALKEAKELLRIGDGEMHFFDGVGYVITRGYEKIRISKVSIVRGSAALDDTIELKVLESMLLPQELLSKCFGVGSASDPFEDDLPF